MYRKEADRWFKHKDFMLLDMICLQVAFLAAFVFVDGKGGPYSRLLYRNMAIFVELADVIVFFMFTTFYLSFIRSGLPSSANKLPSC